MAEKKIGQKIVKAALKRLEKSKKAGDRFYFWELYGEVMGVELTDLSKAKNKSDLESLNKKRAADKVKLMAAAGKAYPDFKEENDQIFHIVVYDEGRANGKLLAFNKDRVAFLKEKFR